MPKILTKDNLLKAGAALAIGFFVLELFVVFLYPSQPQAGDKTTLPSSSSSAEEQFIGVEPASFAIRDFTGIVYFICNATVATPTDVVRLTGGIPGVLGRPIVVGQAPQGNLFLLRTANASSANAALVNRLTGVLALVCMQPLVYREATVYYNSSIPLLARSISTVTKTVNVSKLQFDSYTDQYGNGPKALVADANAVAGDVIMTQSVLSLINNQIKPGSLILEQLQTNSIQAMPLLIRGKVLSFSDRGSVVVAIKWQNRSSASEIKTLLNSSGEVDRFDEEIFDVISISNPSAELLARLRNLSFVANIVNKSNGDVDVLVMPNYTGVGELAALLAGSRFKLPDSRVAAYFNFSTYNAPELPVGFSLTRFRVALVEPVGSYNVTLPANFSAVVLSSTSINNVVSLDAKLLVQGGQVLQIQARQTT